jgi:hypothetical protein
MMDPVSKFAPALLKRQTMNGSRCSRTTRACPPANRNRPAGSLGLVSRRSISTQIREEGSRGEG